MLKASLKGLSTMTLTALLLLGSMSTHAEQMKSLGPWDVHYMVVNTPFLTPEVAKQYGIVRSKYNALINISVLNSDNQQAQTVGVTGSATNLIGTKKDLSFKKVQEGEAIYYLAVLPFRDQETYRFDIQVQKGNDTQNLQFKQKMYVDN
jgi:hypothetical protein